MLYLQGGGRYFIWVATVRLKQILVGLYAPRSAYGYLHRNVL